MKYPPSPWRLEPPKSFRPSPHKKIKAKTEEGENTVERTKEMRMQRPAKELPPPVTPIREKVVEVKIEKMNGNACQKPITLADVEFVSKIVERLGYRCEEDQRVYNLLDPNLFSDLKTIDDDGPPKPPEPEIVFEGEIKIIGPSIPLI